MEKFNDLLLKLDYGSYFLGIAFGVVAGILFSWGVRAMRLGLRRRAVRKARATLAEVNRILSFKQVPKRTVLEITRDRPAPVTGRHRVQSEPEPSTPPMERFREKMDQLMDNWLDVWKGPIRTPELVAQLAYERARGPLEK